MVSKGYIERAKELVDLVKKLSIKPVSSKDTEPNHTDKQYVPINDLTCLIGAGAEILNFNLQQGGGLFQHNVIYQDYRFIAVTKEPHALEIRNGLRY